MKLSIKLLSVLILMIILGAQSTSTQILAQSEWKTTKTLTGSASKDTEDFTVPTNYWRIVYTITTDSQFPVFSIFVYPSGETKNFVAFMDLRKPGTDTSYVRAGPGDFWIHVAAANLKSWTIEVQTQQ